MKTELFIIIWLTTSITCATLAFGMSYAYWQRKYSSLAERERDTDIFGSIALSLVVAFFPPLFIFEIIWTSGAKYGLKYSQTIDFPSATGKNALKAIGNTIKTAFNASDKTRAKTPI